MFYTPNTITISEGDTISGRLSCAPNQRNNRDLDITISYQSVNNQETTTMSYKMYVFFPFLSSLLVFLEALSIEIREWMRIKADRFAGQVLIVFLI